VEVAVGTSRGNSDLGGSMSGDQALSLEEQIAFQNEKIEMNAAADHSHRAWLRVLERRRDVSEDDNEESRSLLWAAFDLWREARRFELEDELDREQRRMMAAVGPRPPGRKPTAPYPGSAGRWAAEASASWERATTP